MKIDLTCIYCSANQNPDEFENLCVNFNVKKKNNKRFDLQQIHF